MGLINHVTRRQATYVWRRRFPAGLGAGSLQVSLRTTSAREARTIGTVVTLRSDSLFLDMADDRLTKEQAKALLDGIVAAELDKFARHRASRLTNPYNDETDKRRDDVAVGLALRLLAEGGFAAKLTDQDRARFQSEGYDGFLIDHVGRVLEMQRTVEQSEATRAKLRRRLTEITGGPPSHVVMNEGHRLHLWGRSAALMSTERFGGNERALADEVASEILSGKKPTPPKAADVLPAKSTVADPVLTAPAKRPEPAYDPDIVALARSLADRKQRRGRATDRTAYQIEATAKLFVEATEVSDLRMVRQSHLARFGDVMAQLPPVYRKSPAERTMTLDQIIRAAKRAGKAQGLSAATVNRNLGFLGQIIKHGRSLGIEVDDRLDLADLREIDGRDDRDRVLPFTLDDLRQIFCSPVWTGCRSAARRLEAGNEVIRDGLYWLPLIAAYTGARREEIAGLLKGSIRQEDGIWVVEITANSDRRIKNVTSRRILPLHSHLIELGLTEYASGPPENRLFPDLTRKSNLGNFGDSIQYKWQKILVAQLGSGAKGKKFHSFRHSVTDALRRDPDVPEWVRRDILGHAATDVEDRVYGSRATPEIMRRAIDRLPRVM